MTAPSVRSPTSLSARSRLARVAIAPNGDRPFGDRPFGDRGFQIAVSARLVVTAHNKIVRLGIARSRTAPPW